MSNILRIPAASTLPAAVGDYQAQNNLLYAFGLWGMGAYPLDLANNKVVKGAIFNVGGVLYKASADETITGTPSNYVKLTPISAGAQCSAAYVANLSGVSWSDTYNGYVDVSGNLYLFDELAAVKNGVVSSPKTAIGRLNGNLPRGMTRITATGSGSFTVPSGVYGILVELIGAGGGGGGSRGPAALSGSCYIGAGGGAGGRSRAYLAVTPGQSISYSVGAGGAGGSAGPNPGSDGGDTSMTGVTTATGGKGGGRTDANSTFFAGMGGPSGFGDMGGGGPGELGGISSLNAGVVQEPKGAGGGAGGSPRNSTGTGNSATGKSGGGSGGVASTGGGTAAGGSGGDGVIIIEW